MAALAQLDKMLAKEENKKLLLEDFQKKFEEGPADFFIKVAAPLLPKDREVNMTVSGTTEITPDQIVKAMDRATIGAVPGGMKYDSSAKPSDNQTEPTPPMPAEPEHNSQDMNPAWVEKSGDGNGRGHHRIRLRARVRIRIDERVG